MSNGELSDYLPNSVNRGLTLVRLHVYRWNAMINTVNKIYGKIQWYATYRCHHIVKEVFDKLELYDKPRGVTPQDVEQELDVVGVVPVGGRSNNIDYTYSDKA